MSTDVRNTWTDEEKLQILEDYWYGSSLCPHDETPLMIHYANKNPGYTLLVNCPRCGRHATLTNENDPLKGEIREWTEEERDSVVDDYFQEAGNLCPICESQLNIQITKTPMGQVKTLFCTCRRCCRTVQLDGPFGT